MKKPSLKSALIAFFGSRNAVGEGSLKAWGAQQRPPVGASTAEALADELVAEGVASVEERSGGRRVWRLVREEESTAEPEPVPEEEPVAVAGAEEPCQVCAALARQLDTRTEERDDAFWRYTARTAERDEALRERDDLRRRLETPPAAAALDQGAIAHYLLSLPEERWASLATARQQLAQAREMAHAAQLLEEAALAAVDGLLAAPAAAPEPVPAPELVPPPSAPPPPPPPQAKRGRRTEDGEPAPGTARAEILAWIRQQPDATARVKDVAKRFDRHTADMSIALMSMARTGYLKRVATGFYRAVKP